MLRNPRPVYRAAAKSLAFPEHDLMSPLVFVDRVHIAARLDTHAAPRPPSGHTVHLGYVDVPPSVELESGLGAESFEVDVGSRMRKLYQLPHWPCARVKRHARRVCVDDEAMVWIGLRGAEHELLVCWNSRIGRDVARWNVVSICGEV